MSSLAIPKRTWLLGLVALLAVLVGWTPDAGAVTKISTCGTAISAPGEYMLAADIGPCPSNGVTITASDVHFNLDGHTIKGTGGAQPTPAANFFTCGGGSGIAVGAVSKVHIVNGTIRGFIDGITMSGTGASEVNNMTITRNCAIGIRLFGADGNAFHANHLTENAGPPTCGGYGFFQSKGNKVTSDDISKNGDFGVFIDFSSTGNTILSSVASHERFIFFPSPGIFVVGTKNTIQATTESGDSFGILVFGTSNTMQANKATGNVSFDLFDVNPACDANTWKADTFGTANQSCIR